jgi:hypothetical protein
MTMPVAYEFLELKRERDGRGGTNEFNWRWVEIGADGQQRTAADYDSNVSTVAVLNSYGQKGWTVALGQHPGVSGEITFLLQRAVSPANG